MTRHHIRPLTYPPKIQPVLEGKCTQTIRPKRLINVGDLIMFHGWSGKPYRSQWSFRTPYWPVWMEKRAIIVKKGIIACFWKDTGIWECEKNIGLVQSTNCLTKTITILQKVTPCSA